MDSPSPSLQPSVDAANVLYIIKFIQQYIDPVLISMNLLPYYVRPVIHISFASYCIPSSEEEEVAEATTGRELNNKSIEVVKLLANTSIDTCADKLKSFAGSSSNNNSCVKQLVDYSSDEEEPQDNPSAMENSLIDADTSTQPLPPPLPTSGVITVDRIHCKIGNRLFECLLTDKNRMFVELFE